MKCISCGNLNFKPQTIKNPQNTTEFYTYLFCTNCGLGVIDLDLSKDFSENYDENYYEYQEASTSLIAKIIELFSLTREEYVLKHRIGFNSILDIGCGVGSFLNNLKTHFTKIYGTELNENAKNIALKKNKELVILNPDLSADYKFDVITMWHVLEHINYPLIFLEDIKKQLDKNSIIFVEVPNNNSINYRIFKENYSWISVPEHLFYYNEKSLKNIFEKLNYEVINIYYPRQFPFLLSNHFSNPIFKILSIPFSLVIFILSPFLKASESIRFCIKLK